MGKQIQVGDRVRARKDATSGALQLMNGTSGTFVVGELRVWDDGALRAVPEGMEYPDGTKAISGICVKNIEKVRDYVADHARRTLRRAGLSKEEARKFVENCKKSPRCDPEYDLSRYSRQLPSGSLSLCVLCAFDWSWTPEGHEYWEGIYNREHIKEINAQTQS